MMVFVLNRMDFYHWLWWPFRLYQVKLRARTFILLFEEIYGLCFNILLPFFILIDKSLMLQLAKKLQMSWYILSTLSVEIFGIKSRGLCLCLYVLFYLRLLLWFELIGLIIHFLLRILISSFKKLLFRFCDFFKFDNGF